MNGEFRVAGWLVERNLNRLSKEGKSVQLEPKAMEVLAHLADHPGEVLSRASLLSAVWPGTHVCDEVLTYCIFELRKALEDDAKNPQIIQTIPRRGYRLIAPVSKAVAPQAPAKPAGRKSPWVYLSTAAGIVAALLLALLWYQPWSPALGESDFLLLTDFVNTTGDSVFDDTLKHALAMHLGQTPFLNIMPEDRVQETLRYMGRSPDEPVTRETGREICIRRGIKAMLVGSIARMGNSYVLSLEAVSGQTGDVIAREQAEASSKEQVLGCLGRAATSLRQKLGESLHSIGRFDVPIEQATTASLEAFKAYSTARKSLVSGRMAEAIPHYLRALEFDPDFASAYDDLAWCYDSMAEQDQAAACARKAYALRERVSEYEKLSIESIYYTLTTGELEKAVETLEMMRTIYPRSAPVHNTLGGRYMATGQLQKAEAAFREAIRLARHPNAYGNLANALMRLGRFQDAKQVVADARENGVDNRSLRQVLYLVAFMEADRPTMVQQVQWGLGKPDEAFMLALQGNGAALSGRMEEARGFFRQAIDAAERRKLQSAAAAFAADAARWEASCGNCQEAAKYLSTALSDTRAQRVATVAAVAMALCGRTEEAVTLTTDLQARYPTHMHVQQVSLPMLRAAIALGRDDPSAALQAVASVPAKLNAITLWPKYLAGEAHRRLGHYRESLAEFHYVTSHRGVEPLSPLCCLARLGTARLEAAVGNKGASGKTYQDLFALWSKADQDVPLLRRALAEYSVLR